MSYGLRETLAEARANFSLLWPLALTQLAATAIAVTDILMMGWLGSDALAAGTLALHFFTILSVAIGGLLTVASPLMAHQVGAGMPDEAKRILVQALKIALAISAVLTVLAWNTRDVLILLGQPAELAASGSAYAKANALAFAPAMVVLLLRNYAATRGRPNLGLTVLIVGICANAVGNYGLMYGAFGLPELGLTGIGAATSLAFAVMTLVVVALVQSDRDLRLGLGNLPGRDHIGELLRLGWPICLTGSAQVGTFLAATLAIGGFGAAQIAGHAIALQSASVGFALMWGGAQASTVRVSWALGGGRQRATERAAWVGMANGMILAALLAGLVFFLRHQIVGLFLEVDRAANLATIAVALEIMVIAAAYQIINAPQLVGSAVLRGLKDTRVPMQIIITTYWLLGAALADILAFQLELQAAGIWLGLTAAVAVSGVIMTLRLFRMLPGTMARLGIQAVD